MDVSAKLPISVRADFTIGSRTLAPRVGCNPAPKSGRRQDKRSYIDTWNAESSVGSRVESSCNTGRKCGRKDRPTLQLDKD